MRGPTPESMRSCSSRVGTLNVLLGFSEFYYPQLVVLVVATQSNLAHHWAGSNPVLGCSTVHIEAVYVSRTPLWIKKRLK